MRRRPFLGLAAQALAIPALGPALGPAIAQERAGVRYPDRPVRFIVPFPPGGGTDVWARMVAEQLQAELGQPILIENRAGATGTIGAELVKRAEPDGYTFLATPPSTLVLNPVLNAKLS